MTDSKTGSGTLTAPTPLQPERRVHSWNIGTVLGSSCLRAWFSWHSATAPGPRRRLMFTGVQSELSMASTRSSASCPSRGMPSLPRRPTRARASVAAPVTARAAAAASRQRSSRMDAHTAASTEGDARVTEPSQARTDAPAGVVQSRVDGNLVRGAECACCAVVPQLRNTGLQADSFAGMGTHAVQRAQGGCEERKELTAKESSTATLEPPFLHHKLQAWQSQRQSLLR